MRLSHIELLQCIECGGALSLSNDIPIIDGVGVFFRKPLFPCYLNDHEKRICVSLGITVEENTGDLTEEMLLTKHVTDNWSYQWNTECPWVKEDFDKDDLKGERCFRMFIRIEPEEYTGKRIVLWCGGNGREAYHISRNCPELLVINEIGDEIYCINGLIDRNINLLLLRCDMLRNPLRSGIADISICDHALQHIVDK